MDVPSSASVLFSPEPKINPRRNHKAFARPSRGLFFFYTDTGDSLDDMTLPPTSRAWFITTEVIIVQEKAR